MINLDFIVDSKLKELNDFNRDTITKDIIFHSKEQFKRLLRETLDKHPDSEEYFRTMLKEIDSNQDS